MELKLKVMQGKNAGQLLPVPGPRFLIGRSDRCHLRPRSDAVAEEQCALELEPARVVIRDLAGNGSTLVNGAAVTGARELKTGDQLKVGPLEFEVQMSTGMASKKAPKVQSPEEAASRLAAGRKKEMDVSSWLDEPAAEAELEAPPTRSVKMSDEERAALGLLTQAELKALQAKQEAESQSNNPADSHHQKAAEALSKHLKKK
jgi:predicted component of type VI protein secretion system